LLNRFYGLSDVGQVPARDALPNVTVPLLSDVPFLGKIFFSQNIMVYVAVVLLIAIQVLLFRTRLGLRIRAVGEHPQAADTAGINVYLLRYGAVASSGLLSGLAGAFLAIGVSNAAFHATLSLRPAVIFGMLNVVNFPLGSPFVPRAQPHHD